MADTGTEERKAIELVGDLLPTGYEKTESEGFRTKEEVSLDATTARYALELTWGELIQLAERAPDAESWWVANKFIDGILCEDIRTIKQIVSRIDGTAPADIDIKKYQTAFGDALREVFAIQDEADLVNIYGNESVMIAIAKTVFKISSWRGKFNGKKFIQLSSDKKAEKDQAVAMIYERIGGRKTTPRKTDVAKFVSPDWMGLPEGEKDAVSTEENDSNN